MKNKKLIFIGEMSKKSGLKILRKPKFSDAVLLSHQSPQLMSNSPYQTIHLCEEGHNSIYLCDRDIQIICFPKSIQIIQENRELTEEEVYDAVTNFVLMEGKKVTFLGRFPHENVIRNNSKKILKTCSSRKMT
ncbi:hypothetical protein HPT25_06490 [Bacillus sp. BRMEA1]|uniref:hypothetical protein n=1 Tax=Neobacillus endophyticus TaxID=2738405 RepID=UPI00156646FC|nr:hypothetical protein [Neobacillus endophyticus]NRD77143.1 hypothetical protein [Neobacillus endophyticus]